ncbi:hypothetical protein BpHYR1_036787 [Brachionus plicatilis]|uniref:Uncharacterized protein n=1 Tax=Brachionus plicatilis TaxID=10195 RepID=A0A3M7QGD7_BRAPC|nr:hypothetical protein BpHYR1_036787 [Brachionus plicatilis]
MDRACVNVFSLDELLINIFIRFKNDNILRNKKSSEYLWQNEIYSYFKKCTTKQTTIKPEEVVKNSRIDFVIEFELAKKEWGIEIYLSNVTNFGDNDKKHVERFFSNEGDYADLIENEKKCCIICICPNSYENKEKEKFLVEGLNSYLSKMNEKCIEKFYKNFLFYIIHLNYSCLNSNSYYTVKKTELKKNKKFCSFFKIF